MKVLIYTFSAKSGVGQYPAQLANGLASHCDVHVFCPEHEDIHSLYSDRVTLHQYQSPSTTRLKALSKKVSVIHQLHRTTKRVDPDVIHLPFIVPIGSILISPLLSQYDIPLVGTVHDPIVHSGMEFKLGDFNSRTYLTAKISNVFDKIIVHGKKCKEQASSAGYPKHKISVQKHGLYDFFRDFEYEKKETEANTLLFFGSIRPNKGYERIPEILDQVEKEVSDITAIVAGSPSKSKFVDSEKIDEIVTLLKNDSRIEFHNRYIPDNEVGEFFSRSNIVVLPYYDATFSGVAMISYSFEVPIVTTDVGDVGELVRNDQSGLVTPANTTQQIAECVVDILSDPVFESKIERHIRECKTQYTWESIGEETLEIYSETKREYNH